VIDQLLGRWLMNVLQPSEERFPLYFCHPALAFNSAFLGGWVPLPSGGEQWVPAAAAGLGLFLWGWLLTQGAWRGRMLAAALMGGALINGLADRMIYGSAATFALCRGFGHVFAFNVGDAAFLLGATLVLIDVLVRGCLRLIRGPDGHFRKL
jgi:hypothetical protein